MNIELSASSEVAGSRLRILSRTGKFDVYDLLLKGDKSKDSRLLPGDVIYIPPIGNLAAISGSVNQPAVYELRNGTTLGELQELGAWKTEAMVKRYAHFAPEQLRKAADRLATFWNTGPKEAVGEAPQGACYRDGSGPCSLKRAR